jgi:hypothetical protein
VKQENFKRVSDVFSIFGWMEIEPSHKYLETGPLWTEPGPRGKEVLSWLIIAHVLQISNGDFGVAVLHPGGGQYDTLTLISNGNDQLVHINRNGVSTSVAEHSLVGIWALAVKSPREVARLIVQIGEPEFDGKTYFDNSDRIAGINLIANFLNKNLKEERGVIWGWSDDQDFSGPNLDVVGRFNIPEKWKLVTPAISETSWHSELYFLVLKGEPVAAVNISLGEAVDVEGKHWIAGPQFELEGFGLLPHFGYKVVGSLGDGDVQGTVYVLPTYLRQAVKMYSSEGFNVETSPIFEFPESDRPALLPWLLAEGFPMEHPLFEVLETWDDPIEN